jgi:hypothetical protein
VTETGEKAGVLVAVALVNPPAPYWFEPLAQVEGLIVLGAFMFVVSVAQNDIYVDTEVIVPACDAAN